MPLAHPVSTQDVAPPPFSLVKDQPVNPAYVPGLPGLPQGKIYKDDYGKDKEGTAPGPGGPAAVCQVATWFALPSANRESGAGFCVCVMILLS